VRARQLARQPAYIEKYEQFSNADYDTLCSLDFRKIRYKKAELYEDDSYR
jgi:hypothetical protein